MRLKLDPVEIADLRDFLERNEKLLGVGLILERKDGGSRAEFTLVGVGSLLTRVSEQEEG